MSPTIYQYSEISQALIQNQNLLNAISYQIVDSSATLNYTNNAIDILLISSGFISIYAFIRTGFVGIIPCFIGCTIAPILTICFVMICQISFNSYIVIAICLLFVFNSFVTFSFIGNIDSS